VTERDSRTTGTSRSPRVALPKAAPDASWASLWLAYRAGPASGILVGDPEPSSEPVVGLIREGDTTAEMA
jgi:hypothetical protein